MNTPAQAELGRGTPKTYKMVRVGQPRRRYDDMSTDALNRQTFRRLIWLMPTAFALHIVEEYRGGFPAWVTLVLGGSFNNLAFAYNNAVFFVIMVGLTVGSSGLVRGWPFSCSSLGQAEISSGMDYSTC
jgi:hypothetical protein